MKLVDVQNAHSCAIIRIFKKIVVSSIRITSWRDVTDSGLHVVWDPFDEVRAVVVLHVQHLLVHFLHGHTTTEHGRHGQVSAMTRVACGHHVLKEGRRRGGSKANSHVTHLLYGYESGKRLVVDELALNISTTNTAFLEISYDRK